MKLLITFLLIVFTILSCKDKKQTPEEKSDDQTTVTIAPDPAADSTAIRKVITDFYNWYNKNDAKFQVFHLYSSIKKKENPPYKINWDEVQKYQDFIRSSVPQLGEEFLQNQKHFFQQCDSAFKVDVEDELPYGFDYDWYTNSQEEPQYLVDEINKAKAWPITWSGDHARVDVKGDYDNNGKKTEETVITVTLRKENGQWKISKIGTD
jgi:hypothetical protein